MIDNTVLSSPTRSPTTLLLLLLLLLAISRQHDGVRSCDKRINRQVIIANEAIDLIETDSPRELILSRGSLIRDR